MSKLEEEWSSVSRTTLCTLRQLGWTISLQMEHSMSMKLNLSSSSSSVSSFPASLQTTHTAVWGRTGCMDRNRHSCIPCAFIVCKLYRRHSKSVLLTHRNALPHNAGLLHAPWPTELLHILTEVTFSTLGSQARFALPAACPPASGSRWAAVGRQLNSRRCPHLGLWPVGCPLLWRHKVGVVRYNNVICVSRGKQQTVSYYWQGNGRTLYCTFNV